MLFAANRLRIAGMWPLGKTIYFRARVFCFGDQTAHKQKGFLIYWFFAYHLDFKRIASP
jgi:hypothetical protein